MSKKYKEGFLISHEDKDNLLRNVLLINKMSKQEKKILNYYLE